MTFFSSQRASFKCLMVNLWAGCSLQAMTPLLIVGKPKHWSFKCYNQWALRQVLDFESQNWKLIPSTHRIFAIFLCHSINFKSIKNAKEHGSNWYGTFLGILFCYFHGYLFSEKFTFMEKKTVVSQTWLRHHIPAFATRVGTFEHMAVKMVAQKTAELAPKILLIFLTSWWITCNMLYSMLTESERLGCFNLVKTLSQKLSLLDTYLFQYQPLIRKGS